MKYVISTVYSTFTDITTNTKFDEIEVQGRFVGVARVSDEDAEHFQGKRGFEVLEADDYGRRFSGSNPETVEVEPATSLTGDPLADAAAAAKQQPQSKASAPKQNG